MAASIRQRPYYRAMPRVEPATALAAQHARRQSGRLDNFVDGAFAFAITLLVISGASLPRTVAALVEALRGVPAFAVCFLQLVLFWHGHVSWRETFDLTDRRSLQLSLLLVFFALIFVFPLHLVYASFFNGISGGVLSRDFVRSADGTTVHSLKVLFACYGLSYACMGGTLAMLFRHGARTVGSLAAGEAISARVQALVWTCYAIVGLLSTLIALCARDGGSGWPIALAGFSYALLGFTGLLTSRYRKRLLARLSP
jgi:hypothetical protein